VAGTPVPKGNFHGCPIGNDGLPKGWKLSIRKKIVLKDIYYITSILTVLQVGKFCTFWPMPDISPIVDKSTFDPNRVSYLSLLKDIEKVIV